MPKPASEERRHVMYDPKFANKQIEKHFDAQTEEAKKRSLLDMKASSRSNNKAPVKPTKPVQPAKPTKPTKPTKPEKPQKPAKTNNGGMSTGAILGSSLIQAAPALIETIGGLFGANKQAAPVDNGANERALEQQRQDFDRRMEEATMRQAQENSNRAAQEDARYQQMMMMNQVQQENARNMAQQQEARAAEREDRMRSEMESQRRAADAENNRIQNEERMKSEHQAALAQQREQELNYRMESEKKQAEEEKRRAEEQHQRETAELMAKHEQDEKFNKNLLDGVLEQQRGEVADFISMQKEAEERMNAAIESRNRDLRFIQQSAVKNLTSYDKERIEEMEQQALRAARREQDQLSEVTSIRSANETEKLKIMEDSENRRNQLHKQLESEMSKIWQERENDIKQRDAVVEKEYGNRKQIDKWNEEGKKLHGKEMKAMFEQHRKETSALYEKLHADNEKYKMDEIDRIAEETRVKLRIVDADFASVKQDAIMAIQRNFCNDFTALQSRVQMVEEATRGILEYVDPHCEEVPLCLLMLQSDFQQETSLAAHQLDRMRGKMRICVDLPADFKKALLAPLAAYEASYDSVKSVSIKIQKANEDKNMLALGPVKSLLEGHLGVVRQTIDKMKQMEMKAYVEKSLTSAAQKSIEN